MVKILGSETLNMNEEYWSSLSEVGVERAFVGKV